MEEFVQEKQIWIYTKLAEKEALRHPVTAKGFVTGEGVPIPRAKLPAPDRGRARRATSLALDGSDSVSWVAAAVRYYCEGRQGWVFS